MSRHCAALELIAKEIVHQDAVVFVWELRQDGWGKQMLAAMLLRNFLMAGNQPVSSWGRKTLMFAKIEKHSPA